ncbi:hypothetical protein MMC32_001980 [Xylographa parallela]|nr:hypothetical protein [Xylographa parallela]
MESSSQTNAVPIPESMTKDILVIGVSHPSANAPAGIKQSGCGNPAELRKKIGAMVESARQAGYKLEARQFAPEELGAKVEEVKQLLQQQSWDGYIVGFGVRGDASLTVHFEALVNAGREICPKARMGFNTHPLDLLETVERMFQ